MLSAIAIDDEPIALDVIKTLAEKIPFLTIKACFVNAFEAAGFLRNEKIDLIFLDIKMPDISGIDFLRTISDPPMVIFTTAYSEHAVQSFELDAIDYLLKPFSLPRFLKACNKANAQYELKQKQDHTNIPPAFIFIKSGYDQIKVNLENILYAESSGNYVQFILKDKRITSRLTMSEAEAILPVSLFTRIHRSYIVARNHVSKIERNTVWINETALPVGASYLYALEKMVK